MDSLDWQYYDGTLGSIGLENLLDENQASTSAGDAASPAPNPLNVDGKFRLEAFGEISNATFCNSFQIPAPIHPIGQFTENLRRRHHLLHLQNQVRIISMFFLIISFFAPETWGTQSKKNGCRCEEWPVVNVFVYICFSVQIRF